MSQAAARPPLLTLQDVRLGWGGRPLFDGLSCAVGEGDRIALVGRNGSGKSTLLKVLAGEVSPDDGERFEQPGASISYLAQDPDLSGFETLGDFAAGALDASERYKAEIAMEALQVRADAPPGAASGGERRRAALARALAGAPDLLLLDEPTNHLDIGAIEWLEGALRDLRAGFVLISHDRTFLSALSTATLWLDRGAARRIDRGFADFETWRDKTFEEEDAARRKLDAKIRREEHWIVHGVSGRRKRNMRRVADLEALKERRRTEQRRAGPAAMALDAGQRSGKLVSEAKSIAKRFGDRVIVADFSARIERRDRVAMVGPNGAGKTTLLKMLIGELPPDEGTVRLGANLETAVFDQARAALDPSKSLWETLTDDKALGVKGSHDQILVRGRPKHVVGYLKEFLFSENQARGPVSALSGGERARLLLAKIMARPSNLLVLDEPTNDLDVETLDLLQELLADYDGTLLLVSHDRDFIDRIATHTIALDRGRAILYAGGWSDYRRQAALAGEDREGPGGGAAPGKDVAGGKGGAKRAAGSDTRAKNAAKASDAADARSPAAKPAAAGPDTDGADGARRSPRKLSYQQQRRLDALPGEIDALQDDIAKLEIVLAAPGLYEAEPKKFERATQLLAERQTALERAETDWLELEELRESLESEAR